MERIIISFQKLTPHKLKKKKLFCLKPFDVFTGFWFCFSSFINLEFSFINNDSN